MSITRSIQAAAFITTVLGIIFMSMFGAKASEDKEYYFYVNMQELKQGCVPMTIPSCMAYVTAVVDSRPTFACFDVSETDVRDVLNKLTSVVITWPSDHQDTSATLVIATSLAHMHPCVIGDDDTPGQAFIKMETLKLFCAASKDNRCAGYVLGVIDASGTDVCYDLKDIEADTIIETARAAISKNNSQTMAVDFLTAHFILHYSCK